jgi:hypothetical protein
MAMRSILLLQAAATLFLTGLIWFVQVVHYPLMARVSLEGFAGYESDHARLTGYVVVIPMLVELTLAFYLLIRRPEPLFVVGAALVALIWLSTFLLQVPQHDLLRNGFDRAAHQRLVLTNWIRTVAWTARAFLVLYLLH